MSDAASAALGARAAQALDLFDLSFLISGASILPLFAAATGVQAGAAGDAGLLAVAVVLVASVISGMVLFAVGRFLRTRILTKLWPLSRLDYRGMGFDGLVGDAIARNGLTDDPAVVAAGDQPGRVYVRWWAELREERAVRHSFALLHRYWVLAATYDGLGTSALLWAIALGLKAGSGSAAAAPIAALAALGSFVCFREATRFGNHQVEELVATIAYLRDAQADARAQRDEDLELWRQRPVVATLAGAPEPPAP
jgi:hypothetical protein